MQDRKVSLASSIAWALWAVAGMLVLADLGMTRDDIGHLGIVVGAAAATIHVRSFFCAYALGYREAYRMGRDAGRGEAITEKAGLPVQRIR